MCRIRRARLKGAERNWNDSIRSRAAFNRTFPRMYPGFADMNTCVGQMDGWIAATVGVAVAVASDG